MTNPKPGTVGALRAALKDVPDDLEITIYATEERADDVGDVDVCVGFLSGEISHSCDGEAFFAIHGSSYIDDVDFDAKG